MSRLHRPGSPPATATCSPKAADEPIRSDSLVAVMTLATSPRPPRPQDEWSVANTLGTEVAFLTDERFALVTG
jgi:hypothetical protein